MSQAQDETDGRYRLARVEISESLIREALAPLEQRVSDMEQANARVEIDRLTEMARLSAELRDRQATPSGPR